MKRIFYENLSGGCCISIDETTDADYARQCFDGSDREWEDVLAEASESNPPAFYIVSSGLSGCYMRDNVSVFGSKTDALRMARDEVKRDAEESNEETDGNGVSHE